MLGTHAHADEDRQQIVLQLQVCWHILGDSLDMTKQEWSINPDEIVSGHAALLIGLPCHGEGRRCTLVSYGMILALGPVSRLWCPLVRILLILWHPAQYCSVLLKLSSLLAITQIIKQECMIDSAWSYMNPSCEAWIHALRSSIHGLFESTL